MSHHIKLSGPGWSRRGAGLLALSAMLAVVLETAAQPPPAASGGAPRLTVRLVPADAPRHPVHERESLTEIFSDDTFDLDPQDRSRTVRPPEPVGYRAALWVRGATVNRVHTFERYYQGKYIDRSAELSISLADLTPGEHVIDPGSHRFTLAEDSRLVSDDPDILIDGLTVALKVYGIDILAVRTGEDVPLAQRLVPERFGLFAPPDPDDSEGARINLLSHTRLFYPLRVYLPANTVGDGYTLEPYGQTFIVHPGGRVELTGERLAGMVAEGSQVLAGYGTFQGRIGSTTGLDAGIGATRMPRGPEGRLQTIVVRPSRRPLLFTAGFGMPSTTFGLPIDPDSTRRPRKVFVADNQAGDPHRIRLVGLEWDDDVFEAGQQAMVNLRFVENTYELSVDDLIASVNGNDDAPAVSGVVRILDRLQTHDAAAAPASHPWSVIKRHYTATAADDGTAPENATNRLIRALNLALHDPGFYQVEGFAGIDLSEPSSEAVGQGTVGMPRETRLRTHRRLLADLFPGLIQPIEPPPSIPNPVVRAAWARYHAHQPTHRVWTDFDVDAWQPEDGSLEFTMPDLAVGFHAVRFSIEDAGQPVPADDGLSVELLVAVLQPGQTGSAAFVTPKGRDAFVVGESVRMEAVIRSRDGDRPAGQPAIVLRHPDGREERIPFADRGGEWSAQPFELDGATTRHLAPGRYELTFDDLPAGIVPWPLAFDWVGTDPRSAYTIVRPSKYDGPMNGLVTSWLGGYQSGSGPVDLDRAVRTIAEQGYNRIELMTYIEDHHRRVYTEREQMAARDWRLPPPEAVYQPSPRDRILNACVRHGIRLADVWLSFNDFHLPRYIEPYIKASERWIQRETAAMRYSPAFDGIVLYDEMYEWGLIGVPDWHTALWPRIRDRVAAEHLGERPLDIRNRWSREMRRPRRERDPRIMARYLELRRFMTGGWGDYNSRMARAARELAPHARIMTYNQGFLQVQAGLGAVSSGIDMDCGFRPDVFRDLDIRNIIHYHDHGAGWLHSPMLVQALRFDPPKPVWINFPIRFGYLKNHDGQFQRRMAFGFLAEGADGISLWGLGQTFSDDRNPVMMRGKETTTHLNREVLEPFGELVTATEPGYRKVGIVHTFNQMALSDYKELRTANQIEEIWIACWRLGFPAVFLREDALEKPLDDFDVIFVPGIRFDGELGESAMRRLAEAIARGARVVVERDSTLDLDGVVRLDFEFNNYFLGPGYNPGTDDDEAYRLFRYSQPAVDFLARWLPEWTQPAARGPFTVGPNWRRGGSIHYLVMGNYEFVDYTAALKMVTARPARIPMTVGPERGNVAYDLLHGIRLPVEPGDDGHRVTVDMTRIQGAMVAFLPEPVGGIESEIRVAADGGAVRVTAALTGESGRPIEGVFPARITLSADGIEDRHYFRALGAGRAAQLRLPGGRDAIAWQIRVREGLTGRTAVQTVARPAVADAALRPLSVERAYVPRPDEVRRFLTTYTNVTLVIGERTPDVEAVADTLSEALENRGIRVTRLSERAAFRYPSAALEATDDGYHTWRHPHSIRNIKPLTLVDEPLILLSSAGGSRLLYALEECGYFDIPPIGDVGLTVQPTVQAARRAFHVEYDVLCLIANDAAAMRHAVAAVLDDAFDTIETVPPEPSFGDPQRANDTAMIAVAPPSDRVGNNEMATDIRFDADGNSYVITWGHGDNLYSLAPDGAVRFTHALPEIGPWNLQVGDDRVVVYTTSGARLYQIELDGQPLWQTRLAMTAGTGDEPRRYYAVHQYAPATRRVVYRDDMNNAMRIIDRHGNLEAHWQGEDYADTEDVAGRRRLHDFALCADGRRLAQIESTRYHGKIGEGVGYAYDSYLVVRDLGSGRKLHERFVDNEPWNVTARVQWRSGDDGPGLLHDGRLIQYDATLTNIVEETMPAATGEFDFGERGALRRVDSRTLVRVDHDGHARSRLDPFTTFPTVAGISPDAAWFVFLDEDGEASIYDAATGKRRATFTVPELGEIVRFTPDSRRVLFGGFRQSVMCFDLDGRLLWQTDLSAHNRTLASLQPLDRVIGYPTTPARVSDIFDDHTEKQWPSLIDEPGQLEPLVTLDQNRLINGDAAGDGGWSSDAPTRFATPGVEGPRSLLVGSNLISQTVSGYIGDHFTWVLEFQYRRRNAADAPVRLTAGLRAQSRHPAAVVRQFDADDTWRFARIVNKSGKDAESLTVGFRAGTGDVLVDAVALRRIRFPSVNHMLYEPVHDITPRVLQTPRFIETYDPLGRLREAMPNRMIIQNLHTISFNLVEAGFLQNARLNDVGSDWYLYPLGATTDIAMGLSEPRWISMVAVYFNAYDEDNVTPHYDILVSDINTRQTHVVAAVRNNRRIFQLSTFPPRLADEVKVRLINALGRQRTVTEIEVYGPLSGKDGVAAFTEPEGQNTTMGDFSRVDRRKLTVGQDFRMHGRSVLEPVGAGRFPIWNYAVTQPLLSEQRLHLGRALGFVGSHALIEDLGDGSARANTLGFGNAGALYGGLWLAPGRDGILYGIDLVSSRTLWSVPLGERLKSGPVAIGNDVFAASDTGRLVALDLGSGALLRETELSGGVIGSLATDGRFLVFISEDGRLQCWDAVSFKRRWSVPVAAWTESTPAIDRGVVYAADRLGVVRAVRLNNGREIWSTPLDEEFMRCPVVTDNALYLGFRKGKLAALNRADGALRWATRIDTRFTYEPLPMTLTVRDQDQEQEQEQEQAVLLVFDRRKAAVVDIADGSIREWQVRVHDRNRVETMGIELPELPLTSISHYRGDLYMVLRSVNARHDRLVYADTFHQGGGNPGTAVRLRQISKP